MDGMPIDSLELGRLQGKAFRLFSSWGLVSFLNQLGFSRFASRHSLHPMRSAPAVCLLTMRGGARSDYVRGGRVLERVWLTLTSLGIAMQPMTGITFLILRLRIAEGEGLSSAHRQRLALIQRQLYDLFPLGDQEALILLFRIGYADPPSGRSLRRPLQGVLISP